MNTAVRIKLEMAARIRTWVRAHPEPTDLYTSGLTRLEELTTRAEALAQQQRNGRGVVTESVRQRRALRRNIQQEPLRHLTRIARAAAAKQTGVDARFKLPPTSANNQAFLTAARDMATEAAAHRELLQRYGMADDFLVALTTALDQYELAVQAAAHGKSAHVGARADLQAVTEELMQLIDDFDAMYQYRYRAEPEQRAAWDSARNVAWPTTTAAEPPAKSPPIAPAA
jgi:hypothetical protein